MSDTLFIRIAGSDAEVTTVVLSAEGRSVEPARRVPLDELARLAAGRRVVLLTPATEAITTRAELPRASQARMRQLLPFSLEESFAADVDTLHFAPGKRLPSGSLAVCVVARERLDAWLALMESAGIRPQAVYSEADGIPDTPSTLTLLVDGQRIYGRRPDEAPFVLEGLRLDQVLDLLASNSAHATDLLHVLVYIDAHSKQERAAEFAAIQSRVTSLDLKELSDGILPRLAATLMFEPGTNLLCGPYAPKSDYAGLLRPWYAAAGLALGWVLLSIVAQGAEYLALRREAQSLSEQVAEICMRSFSATRISACTAEMRTRLAAAGEQSSVGRESFLTTLAVVAESRTGDSRIDALSYRNRIMDLQLTVPSVALLDAFAQQISETDRFDVRIQSANPGESGVEGRVQVVGTAQ